MWVSRLIFRLYHNNMMASDGLVQGNYSLSGALSPLSKLVIIVVMIRGRHRGLPAAIDRAVMLPYGLGLEDTDQTKVENGDETAGETTVQGSGMGTATQTITKSRY